MDEDGARGGLEPEELWLPEDGATKVLPLDMTPLLKLAEKGPEDPVALRTCDGVWKLPPIGLGVTLLSDRKC
jgi:hypothetical protein